MSGIEFGILDFIQTHLRSVAGDIIMPAVTALGDNGILWMGLGACAVISRKHRKTGILIWVSLVMNVLLCNVLLKPLIARVRPCDINTTVQLLIQHPADYSFPSGHTSASFAAVTALYMAKEKYWYFALIPAAMIAFSRLYLYLHYPTDILGGIVVGVFCGGVSYLCLSRIALIYRKKNRNAL